MLNCSRGWNKQVVGIFLNFHKLGGHNKITLGEDCKSSLKMRQGEGGGGENKMEG